MEKEKGKLYSSGKTVIMCTGEGTSDNRFAGVVVEQLDPTSDHRVGNYSNGWTWHPDVFKDHIGEVKIDNVNWKEYVEMGCCQG